METRINNIKCKQMYFKKRGKNLFDGTIVGGYLTAIDSDLYGNTAIYKTIKYKVLVDGNYTISFGREVRVVRTDGIQADTDGMEFTYSWNVGEHYVSFRHIDSIVWENSFTNTIQIEYGSVATPYEPYEDFVPYKKVYVDGVLVFSAGNPVTYVVDTGVEHTEEVEIGASCLSYTPTKSGYTFVGWRKDKTASGDVETNLIMGDEPMTLYAVFGKDVTLSYAGNGATGGSTAADKQPMYYNNGNITKAAFTLKANGFTKGGYTFNGWDLGAVGTSITLDANATATAKWYVTLPYTLLSNYYTKNTDPYGRFSISAPSIVSGSLESSTRYRAWKNENADGDGDYNFSCSFMFTIYNNTDQTVVAAVSVSEDEYESTWCTGGGNYTINPKSSVTITCTGGGSGNTSPGETCRVSVRCDSIVIKSV